MSDPEDGDDPDREIPPPRTMAESLAAVISLADYRDGRVPGPVPPEVHCRICGRGIPAAYRRSRVVGGRYTKAAWCVYCEGEANRELHERMRKAVRGLREAHTVEQEHVVLRDLRELGHPNVDGLVAALQRRRGGDTIVRSRDDV